jgi:hypothetical protein
MRRQSAPAPLEFDLNKGEVEAVASALVSGTEQFFIKIRLNSGGLDELQLTPQEFSDVAFVKRGDRVEFVRCFNPYRDIFTLDTPCFSITEFRIVTAETDLGASEGAAASTSTTPVKARFD